jgi:hypothetical protein
MKFNANITGETTDINIIAKNPLNLTGTLNSLAK